MIVIIHELYKVINGYTIYTRWIPVQRFFLPCASDEVDCLSASDEVDSQLIVVLLYRLSTVILKRHSYNV